MNEQVAPMVPAVDPIAWLVQQINERPLFGPIEACPVSAVHHSVFWGDSDD